MGNYYLRIIGLADENGFLDASRVQESLGLSSSSVRKYLRMLEKEGLVERVGGGFKLTEKGARLKKTLQLVKEKKVAEPYYVTEPETGRAIPLSFRDYRQLYAIIEYRLVDPEILEKHLRMGYIAQWARAALGDEYLAYLIERGEVKNLIDLKNYLKNMLSIVDEE
ncbi:winged helix-turn-helix domain-containing protein [Thermogladius sp. 4427co]|uniref:winged helix-turn-helix domain-containing protein n=1 Tax=Thermogladius sp. 4427co TaxID=3450718 RepID=UPI003F794483